MKKILFNCSNLHSSGTVFVASSVLMNIAKLGRCNISVAMSPRVAEVVDVQFLQKSFKEINIIDNTSIFNWRHESKTLFQGFDTVLTIFGPYYGPVPANTTHICGCVNPLLMYEEYISKFNLDFRTRCKIFITNALHKRIFNKADKIVVETQDAKDKLSMKLKHDAKIQVIESAYNDYCNSPDKWLDLRNKLIQEGTFNVGVLSSNYVYKNIKILNEICSKMPENSRIRFYTTISEDDFNTTIDAKYRNKQVFNVGALQYLQCPVFISKMDVMLCPSLLESCSSIPLDAHQLGKPVFLPNTSFNLCFKNLDNFHFYDLKNADFLVEALSQFVVDPIASIKQKNKSLNSPAIRVQKYLDLVADVEPII